MPRVVARDEALLRCIESGIGKGSPHPISDEPIVHDRPIAADEHMLCSEDIHGGANRRRVESHRVDIDVPSQKSSNPFPGAELIAKSACDQNAAECETGDDDAQVRELFQRSAFEQSISLNNARQLVLSHHRPSIFRGDGVATPPSVRSAETYVTNRRQNSLISGCPPMSSLCQMDNVRLGISP